MVSLLAVLVLSALAAESPHAEGADADDATLVVYGDRVRDALAQLDRKLGTLGYRLVRETSGRTTWVGNARWKSAVVVDHEGYLFFRGHPVSYDRPAVTDMNARLLPPGSPEVTPLERRGRPRLLPGTRQLLTDRRSAAALEARISEETRPEIEALRAAVRAEGLRLRLAQLPGTLDRVWYDGLDGDTPLLDAADRRAALGALWAGRGDTIEGAVVRDAIARFVNEVVQVSAAPFTDAETAHWAAACGCPPAW